MVASHKERLIAGLGGGIAIFTVFLLTRSMEDSMQTHTVLIASMGASAVLLFALPHGPMSQPWNVIGGHVISALIGILVHRGIADPVLASALAVGLAITAMHYLNCLHPPGGASAVIPIILGAPGDGYGFYLAFFPIGTGAVAIVLVAVVFNMAFAWRRYPLALWRRWGARQAPVVAQGYPDISHADFVAALAEIDTFVDISEEDLLQIYSSATRRDAAAQAR